MKNLGKKISTITLGVFFAAGISYAQDEVATPEKPLFSEEQKQMLEENKAVKLEQRETFKATFSEEQLAILENAEIKPLD